MKNKKIKAVLFDLGGVIIDIDYLKTIQAFTDLGLKNAKTLYNQFDQGQVFDDYEVGSISSDAFIEAVQKKIQSPISAIKITEAWNAMIGTYPINKLDFIMDLSQRIPCYLLSNTNEIHLKQAREALIKTKYARLELLFEKCYYSHIIGKRKPHIETFQWVIKDMRCKAEEVLFIDDSPQHIEGAKKAGINTIHFQKDTRFKEIEDWL
mgnify:FL=1